jgi:hypothetical protein
VKYSSNALLGFKAKASHVERVEIEADEKREFGA